MRQKLYDQRFFETGHNKNNKCCNFLKLRFTLEGLAPPILSQFFLFLKPWNRRYDGTKLPILAQFSRAVLSIMATQNFENFFLFWPLRPGLLSKTKISTFTFSSYSVVTFLQNIVTVEMTVSPLRHVDRVLEERIKKIKK